MLIVEVSRRYRYLVWRSLSLSLGSPHHTTHCTCLLASLVWSGFVFIWHFRLCLVGNWKQICKHRLKFPGILTTNKPAMLTVSWWCGLFWTLFICTVSVFFSKDIFIHQAIWGPMSPCHPWWSSVYLSALAARVGEDNSVVDDDGGDDLNPWHDNNSPK